MGNLDLEQFDHIFVPMRGWSVNSNYLDSPSENYSKAELEFRAAQNNHNVSFHGRLYFAGSPKGSLPAFAPIGIGVGMAEGSISIGFRFTKTKLTGRTP